MSLSLALLLTLQAAGDPAMGSMRRETMICPTDGKVVETLLAPPGNPTGTRVDGKPLGTAAPDPLPLCSDGFPLWKTSLAPGEKERVAAILQREDYRAKVAGAAPWYRLYWLLKLDEGRAPTIDLWHVLQQASWEVDQNPALYRRYQEEMLAEIDAALAAGWGADRDRRFYALLMAANAERVLGRMDAARERLKKVPVARLGPDSRAVRDRARIADLVAANDRRIDPAGGRG